jgi:hypothetical protein
MLGKLEEESSKDVRLIARYRVIACLPIQASVFGAAPFDSAAA